MARLTITHRLVLAYCALLLASVGASAWLQVRANALQEQKLVQLLSMDVAEHIADIGEFMDETGLKPESVRGLFDQLMTVNPSMEVYVLDARGKIMGHAAPEGHLQRTAVDPAPIERWLAGEPAPILGDDPRSSTGRKVFSAARLARDGHTWGYVYVILLGEARDMLASDVAAGNVLQTTLATLAIIALLGLFVGIIALRQITEPLRALTKNVQELDIDRLAAGTGSPSPDPAAGERDEIAVLTRAFGRMAGRIADQWRALRKQDEQRREFVATVSHDLRTPLTSLHGYLETLESKGAGLEQSERERYLAAARAQSARLGELVQELFDLARLEHDAAPPEKEPFSLADLVQDVFAKLALLADIKRQRLIADIPADIPQVVASLPLIERALTNLLDNAIRHTCASTEITVRLANCDGRVEVTVSDTGSGLPERIRTPLREHGSGYGAAGSGLGLHIVRRILELHATRLEVVDTGGRGACLRFRLDAAPR